MAQRTRTVIETEQVHLLSVSGALDREGLRELRKHLGALQDAGVRLIMADLCRVTSCDGRLFALLVQSDHLLTRRGGWLRLVGLGPAVLDALDQATLPEVLLVYRASDQAGPWRRRVHRVQLIPSVLTTCLATPMAPEHT